MHLTTLVQCTCEKAKGNKVEESLRTEPVSGRQIMSSNPLLSWPIFSNFILSKIHQIQDLSIFLYVDLRNMAYESFDQ